MLKSGDVRRDHFHYGWVVALAIAAFSVPRSAEAIPVFANGQGVSCEQCHSAPPNLNQYGRYILATNFSKALDAHAQMRENAIPYPSRSPATARTRPTLHYRKRLSVSPSFSPAAI
jgi:hypothetical protein